MCMHVIICICLFIKCDVAAILQIISQIDRCTVWVLLLIVLRIRSPLLAPGINSRQILHMRLLCLSSIILHC